MSPGNNPLVRVLVVSDESCSLHTVRNTLLDGYPGNITEEKISGDEIINRQAPDLIIINSLLTDIIRSELYPSLKNDPVLCTVPTIILSDNSERDRDTNPTGSKEKEAEIIPAEKPGIPHPLPFRYENNLKMTGNKAQVRESSEAPKDMVSGQTEEAATMHSYSQVKGGKTLKRLPDTVSSDDYSVVFNAITSPVIILDSEQYIRDSNHAAIFDVHKAHADLSNLPCYKVFHGPDVTGPPDNCPFVRAMKTKKTETAEMEIETLGRTYQISCTPILNDAGEVMKVIHASTDITRIKDLEAEQATLLCQIKKNMLDMSTLNDGIRNPLTVILGRFDIDECPNPDPIIKQIYRIDNLVTKLDKRWVESLKIVEFVQRHYNISLPDSQNLVR